MTLEPQQIETVTWDEKYRWKERMDDGMEISNEISIDDTLLRAVRGIYAKDPYEDALRVAEQVVVAREVCPAGREIAGAGTGKLVTLVNCYVNAKVEDSIRTEKRENSLGIFEAQNTAGYALQMGGGIGTDFSTIRPRGALVRRTGSVSSGVIPFMNMWNWMSTTIMSSGARRGAMMATLRCDHPDVIEFITAKHKPDVLTQFNVSVLVTDAFMSAVANDEQWDLVFDVPRADGQHVDQYDGYYVYNRISARSLWNLIIKSTYDYAEPGVIFIDRINEMNPLYYCETISCTNPCFTKNTKVWTDRGNIPFSKLVGKTVNVLTQDWEGNLVYRSMTNIRRTRQKAKIVEITFTDGGKVRCTPNHMFYLKAGGQIEARRLQSGMSISSVYRYKANQKGYVRLSASSGHRPLEHHVPFEGGVPKGYHAHHIDGIKDNNAIDNIELIEASEHNSMHMRGDNNPMRRFPEKNHFNNGFVGKENGRWRHDISTEEILQLREDGYSIREVAEIMDCCTYTIKKRCKDANHIVANVKYLRTREDVYCGEVDEFHRFFVALGNNDGVLVHNCGEQPLPPYGACVLGYINLAKMVDNPFEENAGINLQRLDRAVQVGVRLLDNVINVTLYPVPEMERESYSKRRVGLGVMGLANMLQMLRVRYGSEEAVSVTRFVMEHIMDQAYMCSAKLAEERGAFPLYDAHKYLSGRFVSKLSQSTRALISTHGIRNGVLLTIAPTGTTSLLYGNVSGGVEPTFAWEYDRKMIRADGSTTTFSVQDYAYRIFKDKYPDDELPNYMVSAQDLTVRDHLVMQAVCQEFVDSSISKTINCPEAMTFEEFESVYVDAYNLGCKGCTTYRPNPVADEVRGSVLSVKKTETGELVEKTDSVEKLIPAERPYVLPAKVFKIKPSEHAYYVTITEKDDKPFELFISTKASQFSDWTAAIGRMISAIWRRGGDIDFVPEELMQIHSPQGGFWKDGRYIPSVVAAIGDIIAQNYGDRKYDYKMKSKTVGVSEEPVVAGAGLGDLAGQNVEVHHDEAGEQCPKCQRMAIHYSEGCKTCLECGWSNCG